MAAALVLYSLLVAAILWLGYRFIPKPGPPRPGRTPGAPIEPLSTFRWEDTEPHKFRPFKPIYHITMGLQSHPPSELILIDSNYAERVRARRQIMADHPSTVIGAIPAGHAAIRELYSFLVADYLPARYPTIFVRCDGGSSSVVENRVTGRSLPAHWAPEDDPVGALRALGETVEDDLILLRQRTQGADHHHQMTAFVSCHPAGFDPSAKLGKRLAEIHAPVPAYDKIGPSMERFFSRLEVGKSVKRLNWSISTDTSTLFTPQGMHVYDGDQAEKDDNIDIEKAGLRVELQTLIRLPETRAILFSFKTYLYPLADVKAEGRGGQLADAIEGLDKGNALGMWTYKGGIRWGEAACGYLRS